MTPSLLITGVAPHFLIDAGHALFHLGIGIALRAESRPSARDQHPTQLRDRGPLREPSSPSCVARDRHDQLRWVPRWMRAGSVVSRCRRDRGTGWTARVRARRADGGRRRDGGVGFPTSGHNVSCQPNDSDEVRLSDDAEPFASYGPDESPRRSLVPRGETYEYTFHEKGTYKYVCIPHVNQGMKGTIHIE